MSNHHLLFNLILFSGKTHLIISEQKNYNYLNEKNIVTLTTKMFYRSNLNLTTYRLKLYVMKEDNIIF